MVVEEWWVDRRPLREITLAGLVGWYMVIVGEAWYRTGHNYLKIKRP